MKKKIKTKIYEILDPSVIESKLEHRLNIFLMGLIFLNVLAVMLETEQSLQLRYSRRSIGSMFFPSWFSASNTCCACGAARKTKNTGIRSGGE